MRNVTVSVLMVLFAATIFVVQPALAEPIETDVTVHAISKGAKFIGSSMDGARITIENLETGEVLAEGTTTGSTGNTNRIMRQKHGRNRVLSTDDTAKYTTTLSLDKPTRVRITAHGPLSNPEDANSASVTQTLLPGKDLTDGDGVRLQIRGFVVDILSPTEGSLDEAPNEVTVKAEVSMMCGCPIKPNGLWDANDYEIRARLYRDGENVKEVPLNYAGKASQFERTIPLEDPGEDHVIKVYAYDPVTGNTGYETLSPEEPDSSWFWNELF
jgi:hypothetical protein